MSDSSRRDFLRRAVAGAAVAGTSVTAGAARAAAGGQVDRRALGRTGAEVSILGLGLGSQFLAAHGQDPAAADAILRHALDLGVNYWDTAASYSGGNPRVFSEALIGPTVKAVRDRIFMVSKTGQRSYDGYKRELAQTLTRLQTDHLDLYHCHSLDWPRNADAAAGFLKTMEDGCIKAAREAKEQGLIKHFGCTGHSGADVLMQAMRRFQPDVILTTFPCTRPDGGRYEDELLPLAGELGIGIIAMKAVRQAQQADLKGTDLVHYPMSLNGVTTVIVGLDTVEHLEANAAVATNFKPLTRAAMSEMHRHVKLVLGDQVAPWDLPGYRDGVIV